MKRTVLYLAVLFTILTIGSVTPAEARRSGNRTNEIVYVLNRKRPNVYHHHSCSRVRHRDAIPVRRWWAEDKGARPHRCFPRNRR